MHYSPKVHWFAVILFVVSTADVATAPGQQEPPSELAALRALHAGGNYADALATASKIIGSHPTGDVLVEALLMKGLCHAKRKEWEEALVSLKSILVLAPDSPQAPEAAYTAALIHLARREPEQGRAVFRDLVLRWPQSPHAQRARRIFGTSAAADQASWHDACQISRMKEL
ncbi:MAG: tetratricopeptide repeat protein [Planctomycetes bacterium]|nr:tetratricopeptide repeat protein [Planctomycetota bacterium]